MIWWSRTPNQQTKRHTIRRCFVAQYRSPKSIFQIDQYNCCSPMLLTHKTIFCYYTNLFSRVDGLYVCICACVCVCLHNFGNPKKWKRYYIRWRRAGETKHMPKRYIGKINVCKWALMPCNVTKPAWVLNRDNLMSDIYSLCVRRRNFSGWRARGRSRVEKREETTRQPHRKKDTFWGKRNGIPVLGSVCDRCR